MQVILKFLTYPGCDAGTLSQLFSAIVAGGFYKMFVLVILYAEIFMISSWINPGISEFLVALVFLTNSLIAPGGYLYFRNRLYFRGLARPDMIHLLPFFLILAGGLTCFGLTGSTGFLLGNDLDGSRHGQSLSIILFCLMLLAYCTTLVYFLIIIRMLNGKAGISFIKAAAAGENFSHVLTRTGFETDPSSESGRPDPNEGEMLQINDRLEEFFNEHKPFLRHRYSLPELANDTRIPLHYLSAFINRFYRMNFNDFINKYRVQYCKQKLMNHEYRYKKLEAIAEESGFSNRNTFAAAFKKFTGVNPSKFLKKISSGRNMYPDTLNNIQPG